MSKQQKNSGPASNNQFEWSGFLNQPPPPQPKEQSQQKQKKPAISAQNNQQGKLPPITTEYHHVNDDGAKAFEGCVGFTKPANVGVTHNVFADAGAFGGNTNNFYHNFNQKQVVNTGSKANKTKKLNKASTNPFEDANKGVACDIFQNPINNPTPNSAAISTNPFQRKSLFNNTTKSTNMPNLNTNQNSNNTASNLFNNNNNNMLSNANPFNRSNNSNMISNANPFNRGNNNNMISNSNPFNRSNNNNMTVLTPPNPNFNFNKCLEKEKEKDNEKQKQKQKQKQKVKVKSKSKQKEKDKKVQRNQKYSIKYNSKKPANNSSANFTANAANTTNTSSSNPFRKNQSNYQNSYGKTINNDDNSNKDKDKGSSSNSNTYNPFNRVSTNTNNINNVQNNKFSNPFSNPNTKTNNKAMASNTNTKSLFANTNPFANHSSYQPASACGNLFNNNNCNDDITARNPFSRYNHNSNLAAGNPFQGCNLFNNASFNNTNQNINNNNTNLNYNFNNNNNRINNNLINNNRATLTDEQIQYRHNVLGQTPPNQLANTSTSTNLFNNPAPKAPTPNQHPNTNTNFSFNTSPSAAPNSSYYKDINNQYVVNNKSNPFYSGGNPFQGLRTTTAKEGHRQENNQNQNRNRDGIRVDLNDKQKDRSRAKQTRGRRKHHANYNFNKDKDPNNSADIKREKAQNQQKKNLPKYNIKQTALSEQQSRSVSRSRSRSSTPSVSSTSEQQRQSVLLKPKWPKSTNSKIPMKSTKNCYNNTNKDKCRNYNQKQTKRRYKFNNNISSPQRNQFLGNRSKGPYGGILSEQSSSSQEKLRQTRKEQSSDASSDIRSCSSCNKGNQRNRRNRSIKDKKGNHKNNINPFKPLNAGESDRDSTVPLLIPIRKKQTSRAPPIPASNQPLNINPNIAVTTFQPLKPLSNNPINSNGNANINFGWVQPRDDSMFGNGPHGNGFNSFGNGFNSFGNGFNSFGNVLGSNHGDNVFNDASRANTANRFNNTNNINNMNHNGDFWGNTWANAANTHQNNLPNNNLNNNPFRSNNNLPNNSVNYNPFGNNNNLPNNNLNNNPFRHNNNLPNNNVNYNPFRNSNNNNPFNSNYNANRLNNPFNNPFQNPFHSATNMYNFPHMYHQLIPFIQYMIRSQVDNYIRNSHNPNFFSNMHPYHPYPHSYAHPHPYTHLYPHFPINPMPSSGPIQYPNPYFIPDNHRYQQLERRVSTLEQVQPRKLRSRSKSSPRMRERFRSRSKSIQSDRKRGKSVERSIKVNKANKFVQRQKSRSRSRSKSRSANSKQKQDVQNIFQRNALIRTPKSSRSKSNSRKPLIQKRQSQLQSRSRSRSSSSSSSSQNTSYDNSSRSFSSSGSSDSSRSNSSNKKNNINRRRKYSCMCSSCMPKSRRQKSQYKHKNKKDKINKKDNRGMKKSHKCRYIQHPKIHEQAKNPQPHHQPLTKQLQSESLINFKSWVQPEHINIPTLQNPLMSSIPNPNMSANTSLFPKYTQFVNQAHQRQAQPQTQLQLQQQNNMNSIVNFIEELKGKIDTMEIKISQKFDRLQKRVDDVAVAVQQYVKYRNSTVRQKTPEKIRGNYKTKQNLQSKPQGNKTQDGYIIYYTNGSIFGMSPSVSINKIQNQIGEVQFLNGVKSEDLRLFNLFGVKKVQHKIIIEPKKCQIYSQSWRSSAKIIKFVNFLRKQQLEFYKNLESQPQQQIDLKNQIIHSVVKQYQFNFLYTHYKFKESNNEIVFFVGPSNNGSIQHSTVRNRVFNGQSQKQLSQIQLPDNTAEHMIQKEQKQQLTQVQFSQQNLPTGSKIQVVGETLKNQRDLYNEKGVKNIQLLLQSPKDIQKIQVQQAMVLQKGSSQDRHQNLSESRSSVNSSEEQIIVE